MESAPAKDDSEERSACIAKIDGLIEQYSTRRKEIEDSFIECGLEVPLVTRNLNATAQTVDDTCHGLTVARLHLVVGDLSLVHIGHKQTGLHSVVTQTDFLSQDGSRLSGHFLLFVVGK